jgi:hypothetical protein
MNYYDISNLGDNKEKENERRQQIKSIRKYYTSKVVSLKDNPDYGEIQVDYTREENGGRLYSIGISLQSMKKDFRKFLLEGFCCNLECSKNKECHCPESSFARDIDMVNAHPTILLYLLKKYNIERNLYKILERQVEHRDYFMKHYSIKKKDFVAFLNNEKTFIDSPWNSAEFYNLNQAIYGDKGLLKVVEKDSEHKEYIKELKKELKLKNNPNGKLFARFIQRQENEILQLIIQQLTKEGIIVRSLQFDGVIVENNDKLNQSFLDHLMKRINDARDYGIKLTMKNLNSTWQPEWAPLGTWDSEEGIEPQKDCSTKYSLEKSKQLLDESIKVSKDGEIFKDKGKYRIFIDYMNDYMAIINKPHGYTYRKKTTDEWMTGDSSTLKEIFGLKVFNEWNSSDDKREFDRIDFYVNLATDDKPQDSTILNTFIRPKWDNSKAHSIEDFPNFKRWLLNVICNGDEQKFKWFLDYLATLWKTGKTKVIFVLIGERGDGKSIFYELVIHQLLGGDGKYWHEIDNANELNGTFNGLSEGCLLIGIEEMVNVGDKGQSRLVQEKLKSITTRKYIKVEKKYQNAYMIDNNLNFVISTNNDFPVIIHQDNRRYVVLRTNGCMNGNAEFFNNLFEEMENKAEQFRGFLSQRQPPKKLNIIQTSEAKHIAETMKPSWQIWVDNELDSFWNDNTSDTTTSISSDLFMAHYRDFHKSLGYTNNPQQITYLQGQFNRYSTKYKISQITQKDGKRPYKMTMK